MADAPAPPAAAPAADGSDAPAAPSGLAVELPQPLRALRDHVLQAFPQLDASGRHGELTLLAQVADLPALLAFCRTDPDVACELLSDCSAVHWPAGIAEATDQETTGWPVYTEVNASGRIEVDYILRSVSRNHWLRVRVEVPEDAPVVPSAAGEYSSANFMEREVYDLMGVTFTGHPNLTRIMMPDDWEGHPHRKDYPLGGVEVMYKGQTVPPPDEREY